MFKEPKYDTQNWFKDFVELVLNISAEWKYNPSNDIHTFNAPNLIVSMVDNDTNALLLWEERL